MKEKRIWTKTLALTLALILAVCGFSGCTKEKEEAARISVVCAGFAEYDWVKNIAKDVEGVKVTYLGENGVDMHSYQPGAEDVAALKAANLIVYAGGASQEWLDEIAAERDAESGKISVNLLWIIGENALAEEIVEGMQADEEEAGSLETDEHTWLSLGNAVISCKEINRALDLLDADHAAEYDANCAAYVDELQALDMEFVDAMEGANKHTMVFGDRFPFRYMMEDYDLQYFAAFPGCSADSEASFETIVFLADKCDKLNLPAVIELENSTGSIAKAVAENAKGSPKVLTMNSMQSVKKADIEGGATYLSIMEGNLETVKEALDYQVPEL